jgi:hypothetical protein
MTAVHAIRVISTYLPLQKDKTKTLIEYEISGI